DQFLVERHLHSLARSDEIEHPSFTLKALFTKQQPLHTELHALRFPRALWRMGTFAAFVINGNDHLSLTFRRVDLRRHPETLRGQPHGTLMNRGLLRFSLICPVRFSRRRLIDPPVMKPALRRLRVVGKLPIDPLEVSQPRAIGEFIDHPRGEQRKIAPRGWR